jgi:signal transduction histidine kinase
LAGATAHELNQPLTSVMGIVEIMLAAERPESEEQRLERAYEQLERMAEIVRDLSKVTQFKTTQYVEGVNILDLQQKLK